MPLIATSDLDALTLSNYDRRQVYNGLDNCLTSEILAAEHDLLAFRPHSQHIYNFNRALQAPYLDMMLRGFRVNIHSRHEAVISLRIRIERLQAQLNRLSAALMDAPCNPRSRNDLIELFYNRLRLPEVWTSKKGERKMSLDRHALEKLNETYIYSRPFINHILAIRDLSKQLEVLTTNIDIDNRFRTSYNLAGTETGRPSSSESAFGSGGNAQNIAPNLRYVFEADPGYVLVSIDFEQSEARDVGYLIGCLFGDWSYLDACESGDLHTANAKLVWPELPWTGDPTEDRTIASRSFYRDFTYRDMAKRGSHLSNYMGTAFTMGRHLKIPQKVAEEFQARYCKGPNAAFPSIPRYWQWVIERIQTTYSLVTPFGRERHFFGNTRDDATAREAIAFLPQSMTSDRTNLGLWRTWKHLPHRVQLLAQGYDSITFQALNDPALHETIAHVVQLLQTPLTDPTSGRSFTVPVDIKVGQNWGAKTDFNPNGLSKYQPQ